MSASLVASEYSRRWNTGLLARIDSALDEGAADLDEARRLAWRALSEADASTRMLLDAYDSHPVVEAGQRRLEGLFASVGLGVRSPRPDNRPDRRPSPRRQRRRRCPARAVLSLLVQ